MLYFQAPMALIPDALLWHAQVSLLQILGSTTIVGAGIVARSNRTPKTGGDELEFEQQTPLTSTDLEASLDHGLITARSLREDDPC